MLVYRFSQARAALFFLPRCEDQPGLYKSQFFIAFFINFVSYPFCISISQSIFSKALGPRPQVRLNLCIPRLFF